MAEVVATIVVGPLLSMVKDKVSSYLLEQYRVMEGMEEQHETLKLQLPAVLDVITDAEQAAAHRDGVRVWLEALKKVAYQASDAFDEFKYEALRRQARHNGHYAALGFHMVKRFPTNNRVDFRKRMGKKLHGIVQELGRLVDHMNQFGFTHLPQAPTPSKLKWREMDSVIFDPEKIAIRSRCQDTRNIIDILVGQAKNPDLAVLPIVGVGGIGKTTQLQLVFNDPQIHNKFRLLLWVCVSDNFDADNLAKRIVEEAGKKGYATAASSERPLDSLQNAVRGQKFLLVLDDVWNRDEDEWKRLKASLDHGGKGSVVLTTTRDEKVANIMRTVQAYHLTPLGDKFIEEIIETRAFSLYKEEERPAVLVNMVGEIAKRCVGSPLAAKALGSVLRDKDSEEEWKAVSSNICTAKFGILPILKLSYNELQPRTKQCFAFCALFPKDREIGMDELIQLWIALGYIQEENGIRPETTGENVFNELASKSFFQDVKQVRELEMNIDGYYKSFKTVCKIHDLMHDVALSVMGKECAAATHRSSQIKCVVGNEEPIQNEHSLDTARHLFLSVKEPAILLNDYLEKSSPAIQTLLCDDSHATRPLQHSSKYNSLQALRLCSNGRSFPLKPKHLHHLRYLDISQSWIRALPEDISILHNLQTLNVSGCYYLERFPKQMKYMTALRHFYTHGCSNIKYMPPDLGKLTSLQTLTCFVAGSSSDCSNVGELQNLNLGGQLELNMLENVTVEDAKAANLENKNQLRELTLIWKPYVEGYPRMSGCEDDARVLEVLKPHDGLHAISIHSYAATTFPTWMDMLRNMVEIRLSYCGKVKYLFTGEMSFSFPNLKRFKLEYLDRFERLSEKDTRGQGEEIIFPQLEDLAIVECEKFTALPEAFPTFPALKNLHLNRLLMFQEWVAVEGNQGQEIMFPQLENLFIFRCEKFTALPGQSTFPNLQDVDISDCPEFTSKAKSPKLSSLEMTGSEEQMSQWLAGHMTSLTKLNLVHRETNSVWAEHSLSQVVVDGKKEWNHEFPLTVMRLCGLKSSVSEICACFVQLQDLSFDACDTLVYWPEKEFQLLVSLRSLRIGGCSKLIGYAQAPLEQSTSSERSQLLPSLDYLQIIGCESLVEVFDIPASLRKMEIRHCSKVESIFGRRLLQQGKPASSIVSIVVPSSSAGARAEHSFPTCLETLSIFDCRALSFLPDVPQAYSSLRILGIEYCPGIKTLPTCLQQRLGSLQYKEVDARYEEPRSRPRLWKPQTWKYAIREN